VLSSESEESFCSETDDLNSEKEENLKSDEDVLSSSKDGGGTSLKYANSSFCKEIMQVPATISRELRPYVLLTRLEDHFIQTFNSNSHCAKGSDKNQTHQSENYDCPKFKVKNQ